MHCLVISMRGIEPHRKLRRIYTLGSKVERAGQFEQVCASFSSLQSITKEISAIQNCQISLITVLEAILTRGQRREKFSDMSNNFRKTAVLKNI